MKKSELYRMAQHSVLKDMKFGSDEKLEIIKELQKQEDSALFWEKEAKKNEVAEDAEN